MQSIGDYPAHVQRQKRSHRRAMPHNTTPAQRAQYVAESIALRAAEGEAWTWSLYGLETQPAQQQLVLAALAVLRGEAPAPLPLVALVAQRDALIRCLAGEPDPASREAFRGQLTAVLVEIDRRYGR